jgi:hypothetical protein
MAGAGRAANDDHRPQPIRRQDSGRMLRLSQRRRAPSLTRLSRWTTSRSGPMANLAPVSDCRSRPQAKSRALSGVGRGPEIRPNPGPGTSRATVRKALGTEANGRPAPARIHDRTPRPSAEAIKLGMDRLSGDAARTRRSRRRQTRSDRHRCRMGRRDLPYANTGGRRRCGP